MRSIKQALRRNKEIDDRVENFFTHQKNNNWKNFDYIDMCKWVYSHILLNLIIYGQTSQELFLRDNLKLRFPYVPYESIDKGHDEMLVEDANGNEVHLIRHILPVYKKYETMLYQELHEKYVNDLAILNLKDISSELSKMIENDCIGFSEAEIIVIIDRALKAYQPDGPIWIRLKKSELEK